MAQENKPHLSIDNFSTPQDFRSRRRGRSVNVPLRPRQQQGENLAQQYRTLLERSDTNRANLVPISQEMGVYIELISFENCELPLQSLDNKDFELRSCRIQNNREIAVVFVPDSRRNAFQQKLNQYLDPSKDGMNAPRNHNLIDSIEIVRLANIRSFWTEAANTFPTNQQQQIWWELWLKKNSDIGETINLVHHLSERLNLRIGNTSQTFFDTYVILIYASIEQLESATELISSLEELRSARINPNFFVESSPTEQIAWVENLNGRLSIQQASNVAIAILDNGINYNHPILSQGTQQTQAATWDPTWPKYNDYALHSFPGFDHGSRQAGIAVFGDLRVALLNDAQVVISHNLESGRILPAVGANDPELYGAITTGVAGKLETDRPFWRRVFSLAVTADSQRVSGQPTSWSSEIDQYSFNFAGDLKRLFVISTGNIRNLAINPSYWDQINLADIEEPAQSWNALTVGAYTELCTNDDPVFEGWSPLAPPGDVSPVSRSSVNWRWRKHAPFKPDLVAEGGNRLLSPDHNEITNADVVSLLTTSGRTTGQLFEVSGDSSAATAIVSRQAAILMVENPNYWPETIRGLLIHSADWTMRMQQRYGELLQQHSPRVAKETMLRTVGYGVSNLERARFSANHALTLVAQNTIQPFIKLDEQNNSTDPTLNEMTLYELPWPIAELQQLDPQLEVKLRVTLSYFIEPNPGQRGYRQRFSYQSHGLRFEIIRPGQSLENFKAAINRLSNSDDYEGIEGDADGWKLGSQLRTRGTVHSDTWIGSAQALADMHTIAVFPVGGWWKYKKADDRWRNEVRFSLIVSIDVPDVEVDIYTSVANTIQTEINV